MFAAIRDYLGALGARRLRIAIVTSNFSDMDAISGAARDTFEALSSVAHWRVSLFAPNNQFPEIPVHLLSNAAQLKSHPAFTDADVIIHHYGFHSPLFEAARNVNGARQILVFHNVTPEQYVAPSMRDGIRRSFEQLEAFRSVDRIWAVSETNADVLRDHGFDESRIGVFRPAIHRPPRQRLSAKESAPLRILFVGRITPSKGLLDLVQALAMMRAKTVAPFSAKIAGIAQPHDVAYRDAVVSAISEQNLSDIVQFTGPVELDRLIALFHEAHVLAIPSYHEGFCRPVVEGLRAGCVPVGYDGYNLPRVVNGLGRTVKSGDVAALADALALTGGAILAGLGDPSARLPLDGGEMTVSEFDDAAWHYAERFNAGDLWKWMVSRVRALTAT